MSLRICVPTRQIHPLTRPTALFGGFEYTERIKINGNDISKNDFAKYVFVICDIANKNKIHLTEFEV